MSNPVTRQCWDPITDEYVAQGSLDGTNWKEIARVRASFVQSDPANAKIFKQAIDKWRSDHGPHRSPSEASHGSPADAASTPDDGASVSASSVTVTAGIYAPAPTIAGLGTSDAKAGGVTPAESPLYKLTAPLYYKGIYYNAGCTMAFDGPPNAEMIPMNAAARAAVAAATPPPVPAAKRASFAAGLKPMGVPRHLMPPPSAFLHPISGGGGTSYSGSITHVEGKRTMPAHCMTVGEITAWRIWTIKHGYVASVAANHVWAPNQPTTGKPDEGYGVHAWKTLTDAIKYGGERLGPCILGRVQLWGMVDEHDIGYRAEFAKIISFDRVLNVTDRAQQKELLTELRKTYGLKEEKVVTTDTGVDATPDPKWLLPGAVTYVPPNIYSAVRIRHDPPTLAPKPPYKWINWFLLGFGGMLISWVALMVNYYANR